MKTPRKDKVLYLVFGACMLVAWAFLGVLHVDDENEQYDILFLKRRPTLRLVFRNPYMSEPRGAESEYSKRMDGNGDWLPGTPELNDYLIFCKARYAVDLPDPIEARTECRKRARRRD